jgi:thiol:disulfide interchange protein DsbD
VTGLALAYGAGIVGIFTLVGVVFGEPVIAFATLWWVNLLFALLFLVFGLSLIGLFEIRLPGFFNDIAAKASGTGGYLSVFAMGATLVITSFTCTAPIIGLVLVWAAQGGSLFKVGFTMAIFGLTMAIPFVFLSLSPKALQKMPRSGEWMQTLKVTLGIVELGLVLKFLSNIDLAIGTYLIDRELFLGLWGLSFLAAALYLLGVFQLGAGWSVGKGRAAAGVALLAVTAYLGSGLGGDRLGKNLEAFLPILPERELEYTDGFLAVVKEDYEKGVAKATELGAPIFLDFTGFL